LAQIKNILLQRRKNETVSLFSFLPLNKGVFALQSIQKSTGASPTAHFKNAQKKLFELFTWTGIVLPSVRRWICHNEKR
jgi:hypothetical protein